MSQPNLDDSRIVLLTNVSQLSQIVYDTNKFYLGNPEVNTNTSIVRNTVVSIIPYSKSDYYGARTVYYNRVDLATYTLSVERKLYLNLLELLQSISVIYPQLSIGQDDVFNQVLPVVPVNTFSIVLLKAKPNSYGFINETNLQLIPVRVPSIESFIVTPLKVKLTELITLNSVFRQLKSNVPYNLKFYVQLNDTDTTANLFLNVPNLLADVNGSLLNSVQTENTITKTNFKILLLLIEQAQVQPPATINLNQLYGELFKSQKIAIVTLEPNQFLTSALFGALLEENFKIDTASITPFSFIEQPKDTFAVGTATLSDFTLRETIIYKSESFEEISKFTVGAATLADFTLRETIIYKSQSLDEISKFTVGAATLSDFSLIEKIRYLEKNSDDKDNFVIGIATIAEGTLT